MGIKIKGKILRAKNFCTDFSLNIWNFIFFNFFLDILITKFRFTDTKLNAIPLQEHAHTSMLALHSCNDSQLWVKNVEKNQKNCKIRKKFENFKTPYKNLEK